MNEDRIYIDEKLGDEPFRFDASVAAVFPDMLRRSIPGYEASLEAIGALAARYVRDGTTCYDLGCSLGAATLAMRQGIRARDSRIVAIDNAQAMIDRCAEVIARDDEAAPGHSEHHTGRAVDIATPGSRPLTEEFEDTDAFRWLTSRAVEFGFSLTYPRDNPWGIAYEPWHWSLKES